MPAIETRLVPSVEEGLYASSHGVQIVKLAFPENKGTPMHSSQAAKCADISVSVASDFRFPVFEPRLRHPTEPAVVTVPKAAVDEYDLTP